MSYFSRLTDIVTCSLTEILADEANPREAIQQIISEMNEGLAGAKRSVATATASEERLRTELDQHGEQVEYWANQAKEELTANREEQARLALIRKREVEDLIAGLQQQHNAAAATREHLTTTLRALEARLADAQRRQQQLESGTPAETAAASATVVTGTADAIDASRARQIDDELDALKRELGQAE